uniref:Uncharacterized protein n=1 Tax=Biomphalaria glabrata TaxID=6526 RepID=A0A2C9LQL1_BIOGL
MAGVDTLAAIVKNLHLALRGRCTNAKGEVQQNPRVMKGVMQNGSSSIFSADGKKLLTDKEDILFLWAKHFSTVLNCPSSISAKAIERLEQVPINHSLADPLRLNEVMDAISNLSTAIYGEPNCSWKLENVTCSISKVYPQAKCNLNGTFGEDGKNITYQHITIENENGTYYNTSCTFRIEAANENQNMTVTIYPNVTGKDTDSQYGKTITLKVSDLSTTVQFTTTIPHSTIGSYDSMKHF